MTCMHAPVGFVSNHPEGYAGQEPYAMTLTCSAPKCIRKAYRWVAKQTDERSVLVTWNTEPVRAEA